MKMQEYEVQAKIGNGAFGEVFRAKHIHTGRVVAIKKVRVIDDEALRVLPGTLFQEMEALRQLEHVNVVNLLDVFADGSNLALVLEYVETDLFSVIRSRTTSFTNAEIRGLLRMLLSAVSYCHDRKILHRDIKPGNLLLDDAGQLKLTDFGLATVYVGASRTYSHQVATRWYRAPELLFGSRDYDGGVDMWAVGAVFAELLHLVPLFPGMNDIDQLYRIIQVFGHPDTSWPEARALPDYGKVEFPPYAPLPLDRVFPDASPLAVDLLGKLLSLNPRTRITARDALRHPYFFDGPVCTRYRLPPIRGDVFCQEERKQREGEHIQHPHRYGGDITKGNDCEDAFLASLGTPLAFPFGLAHSN